MICRPASMAASSALMLLGRPTNSGMTMWGKTTTSRSGSRGSWIGSVGNGVMADIGILWVLSPIWTGPGAFQPGANSKPSGLLGRFSVHEQRRLAFLDRRLVDHDLVDVRGVGQVEHRVDQRLLQDRAQAARAGLAGER